MIIALFQEFFNTPLTFFLWELFDVELKNLFIRTHFSTRVREHLVSDKASHIFRHLKDSPYCRALCSADNFHVLDHASAGFQHKIKEAIDIQREQPSLNQQLHHVNLKLSF